MCLYGGQPIGKQINALKRRPQIVVATPGRLSDHMKRRTVVLNEVSTVVLDEADRMLDMGFIHDVRRILDKIPNRKNLGMFSATISREVMDISWIYQRDPEEITVQATQENKPIFCSTASMWTPTPRWTPLPPSSRSRGWSGSSASATPRAPRSG